MKYQLIILLLGLAFFTGCSKDGDITHARPEAVTNFVVTPINGGAEISYTVPKGEDISYVLAEYVRSGQKYTERSSIYKNKIRIEGFATQDPVQVDLYVVSRKEVKSEPVKVSFNPLISPIKLIEDSASLIPDFAGVTAVWQNNTGAEVGLILVTKDEKERFVESARYYSLETKGQHLFSGFDDQLQSFGIFFEDKWGNMSDTLFYNLTPYYEMEVEKPFGQITTIPYDNNTTYSATYLFSKICDGIKGGNNSYLTKSGSAGVSFTLDLKSVIKLSRIIMWHRWQKAADVFGSVNVMSFEMWGIRQLDMSKIPNRDYWLDEKIIQDDGTLYPERTFKDDWEYLGLYQVESPVPGTPEATDDAILAAAQQGFEFRLPIGVGPVRYIRLFARSSGNSYGGPPVNNYYQISELSFFGNDKIE